MMSDGKRPIIRGLSRESESIHMTPPGRVGVETDDLLGVRRPWTQISATEIIFLVAALLATVATDGLSIYRLTKAPNNSPDFVYGILIIISSVFLLIFLVTGIFQQRVTDIVAFFISAVLLTTYVVVHYILREKDSDDTDATLRLVRLVCTATFNVIFLPLSIRVIRKYQRGEFSQRLLGARVDDRWPLRIYNIFDCIARINTMLSVSVCFLNLYNYNEFVQYDKIFLGLGVPLAFLWLGLGIGMIHLENRALMVIFYLFSLLQPAFLIVCLISAVKYPATTTTMTMTRTTAIANTLTMTSTPTSLDMTTLVNDSLLSPFYAMLETAREIPVTIVLYVCAGLNAVAHISSVVLSLICVGNFGRGLKQEIFISKPDKFFQKLFSRS